MLTIAHFWVPFNEFVFMRRALLGGLVLACSTAPLGVFLILRRMSLIGDAVAHGILPHWASGSPGSVCLRSPSGGSAQV